MEKEVKQKLVRIWTTGFFIFLTISLVVIFSQRRGDPLPAGALPSPQSTVSIPDIAGWCSLALLAGAVFLSYRTITSSRKVSVFADWDEELESDNFDQFDQLVENNDVTGLIDALRHPDPDWRLKAAEGLGDLGFEVTHRLEDDDPEAPEIAVEDILEPLLEAIHDPVESVRESVANALGRIGNEVAVGALTSAMNTDTDPVVDSCACALSMIKSPAAKLAFIKALDSERGRSLIGWPIISIRLSSMTAIPIKN